MRHRLAFCLFALCALLAAGLPAHSQATRLAATGGSQTVYLPLILTPQASDLVIDGVEVTQAVQTPNSTVPLVAGRPAIVRVYAHTAAAEPLDSATVTLTGTRNGQPLPPVTIGPQTAPMASSRGNYASSFNVQLPAEWLAGNVQMIAAIDGGATFFDTNPSNNVATTTLVFNPVPPLNVIIVPIQYTDQSLGRVFDAPTQDSVSEWVERAYPLSAINVSFHAPIALSGDLEKDSDWNAFLNAINTLKESENEPSTTIYYGLVSSGSSPASTWVPLANGFILGIGIVGSRASLGLDMPASFTSLIGAPNDMTSETAAHEIGHNLGRLHAPCGATQGLDPQFPYAGASIGQYGVDITAGTLLAPNTTKDVMSYCDPQWISDYTYTALYEALQTSQPRRAAAPAPSLLFRATLDQSGAAIAPTYALAAAPDPAPITSDYHVEMLDAQGKVVQSQPVAVREIEQPHHYAVRDGRLVRRESPLALRGMASAPPSTIAATVPLPGVPIAEVRLLRNNTVLARRAVGTQTAASQPAMRPSVLARQGASTVDVRWGQAGTPALVRYSADGGQTWTTLGVDVPGGALQVDVAALPSAGHFEVVYADGAAPSR